MDKTTRILEIIAEILDIEISELNENMKKSDIPEWDSLAHVQIIAELEAEFDVSMPFERILDIENIGDLISML